MSDFNSTHIYEGRESLLESFLHVREVTELITGVLTPEDAQVSALDETSPPKWHLAHTTWFFNKFVLKKNDEVFDFIFNSYYVGVGERAGKDQRRHFSRPSLKEVLQYRARVTEDVAEFIRGTLPENLPAVRSLIQAGINHEQQHQELLFMDIKANFYANPLRPRYEGADLVAASHISSPGWQNIPSGLIKIGRANTDPGFSYDNEGDSHFSWVESFMLSTHLVTNGDYLQFMEDKGYDTPLLWLSDGEVWKEREGIRCPLYWENRDGEWWVMTLSGMVPLDLSAPVSHVSYYEADAYARWKGCRLPTEFEWEAAASREPVKGHFMEVGHHEPRIPLEEHRVFSQIHGTLWEWTRSAYLPYPRFEPAAGHLSEYNGKFMCNQMVLRGGSCVTPRDHYRVTYRNFFYPHQRWQFSGIRLAKDLI